MAKKKISKKSKRRLMTLGTLSVFAIGYFLVTFVCYFYSYITLNQEEKKLKNELLSLQEEKANLKIEIQKLNNPEYVARYAKQKYLYSSNGEYVLKIDSNEVVEEKESDNKNFTIPIIASGVVIISIIVILKKKKPT